ncbi:hypothetical protein BH10ACI2_BH10ACI2_04240 [soil metagenome]
MTQIIYKKDVETTVRDEVEKFLRPFVWLIPTWCHELHIEMQTSADGENAAIRTGVTPEYRFAHMTFYSAWLTCTEEAKTLHVVHDLLHIANCPYVDFAEEVIRNLLPKVENERFYGYLMEQSRFQCESMTQDLAKAIYERFRNDHTA